MKKLFIKNILSPRTHILALYLTFVINVGHFLHVDVFAKSFLGVQTLLAFVMGELCGNMVFMLLGRFVPVICRRLSLGQKSSKRNTGEAFQDGTSSLCQGSVLIITIIPVILFTVLFIAVYPGCFVYDSFNQLDQVYAENYNDWHPFMQTFFSLTLPLKLTGNRIASIMLFQYIWFTGACVYATCSICKYCGRRVALATELIILMNPAIQHLSAYPIKDFSFAGMALVLTAFVFRIVMSRGDWLKKPVNIIFLVIAFTLTSLFRHNAILFTIPLIILLICFLKKKTGLLLAIVCIMSFLIVKYPIRSALDIGLPGNRHTETMGLPLTIMGNAYVETPELVDDEVKYFLDSIAPWTVWNSLYKCGSFNELKFNYMVDTTIIEETSVTDILNLTFKCFKESHAASMRGLMTVEEMVYGISGPDYSWQGFGIARNNYGIEYSGNKTVRSIAELWSYIMSSVVTRYLFNYLGVWNLICVGLFLFFFDVKDRNKLKLSLLCFLPILIHNVGTSLLLTGFDFRFFLVTYMVVPVMTVLAFANGRDAEGLMHSSRT